MERGMGDWWMDQWKHNSMQILGKLCFREQGLRLTGVTFPTTKQPPKRDMRHRTAPEKVRWGDVNYRGARTAQHSSTHSLAGG